MKAKILLATLVTIFNAANAEPVGKTFSLECAGPNGTVKFQKTNMGVQYDIAVEPIELSGFVQNYVEAITGDWEQGSASYIKPSYSQGSTWLSVTATKGSTVWSPPFKGCKPTRADDCKIVDVPGHFFKSPQLWVNILVDVTNPDSVTVLNLDLPGEGPLNPLGEPSQCVLTM